MVNVTMLDGDWPTTSGGSPKGSLTYDPYDLTDEFYKHINLQEPASKSTLYHFVAHFFAQIGVAMKRLQGRCTVGIIHGEISSVMGKNRCNALDRGQGFPNLYNQILMSNIPSVPS